MNPYQSIKHVCNSCSSHLSDKLCTRTSFKIKCVCDEQEHEVDNRSCAGASKQHSRHICVTNVSTYRSMCTLLHRPSPACVLEDFGKIHPWWFVSLIVVLARKNPRSCCAQHLRRVLKQLVIAHSAATLIVAVCFFESHQYHVVIVISWWAASCS